MTVRTLLPRRVSALRLGKLRLPAGRSLPVELWEKLHRGILVLLALHAVSLGAFALYMELSVAHAIIEGGAVGIFALLASMSRFSRRTRSILGAAGLMTASAVLVHLSGGYIESHFHFFVMLGIIFLYEDWLPYAVAIGYVAVHHGVAGTLDPLSVYNHPAAIASPWQWAIIHAVFLLGLSSALLVAWNVIERARDSEARATGEALDLKRQLHSQEKMAALGSLVSGLAHEVRTPITIASTNASLIELAAEREPTSGLATRIAGHAAEIRHSMDRVNMLVQQLRKFHALAPEDLQVVPLHGVVRDALRLFHSANKASRSIEIDLATTPPARLQPLGVHQVVINLMSNAMEATDASNGIVRIRTGADEGHATLIVEDNGVGMDEDTQRKAFDPLFTTKEEGMGLGLHIVRRIVEAHGGEIRLRSRSGHGTSIEVRFPLAPAAHEPPATAPEARPASSATVAG